METPDIGMGQPPDHVINYIKVMRLMRLQDMVDGSPFEVKLTPAARRVPVGPSGCAAEVRCRRWGTSLD